MIIPSKYQVSKENDPNNSLRINNITKIYNICIKKFGKSDNNNKLISNKNNKGYCFQEKIIEWFFNLPFIERVKVSSINNKWVFQILHQLYIEQIKKPDLKFIPRITEDNIHFKKNLQVKNIFFDNPGHFLNYFAFCSEKYELINGYDKNIEKEFLDEIIFFYPDLAKISKIKQNGNDNDLLLLIKYHYPIFTLSESILNNKDKFLKYFKTLSNNTFFVMPPEIIYQNSQKQVNNNIINNININALSEISLNNNSNKNNKNQNIIDLPIWAKQPMNSKLCFSINELFLAFFEQNIIVYYIIFLYDKNYYNSLINDNINKNIEEFFSLKNELKTFLGVNVENIFNLLDIEIVIKEIYYNSNIEKFINIKKYQNNLEAKTKFWKENISYEQEFNLIKDYFNKYYNDNKKIIKLIDDISMLKIEQVYSFEDFFLNKILFNLNKKYEIQREEDLFFDLTNNLKNNNKKQKKKNKKRKKKKDNDNNIKDEIKFKEKEISNNNNVELKKYIIIEEDEELRKIKKGYSMIDNNNISNLTESSGSENNYDTKPLLDNDDYKQIMKEKENFYNSDNEEEKNKNGENDNQKIFPQKNININLKEEEDNNNKENNLNDNNKNDNSESNNKNSQENIINLKENSNNGKKKKGNNIFLYPTVKKSNNKKINKPPFILKLNEDILSYNQYLLKILNYLSPIKEHIIETIKSDIKLYFLNKNYFYQIEVYGSYKSNLDIVSSDIDMVFIPQNTRNLNISDLILKLSNHLQSLKKYNKITPIYTASVPLIKLMIKYDKYIDENKSLLDNYSKLISSYFYKNYPYDRENELSFINIDISFPINFNNKKGKNVPFQQIEFIKNSLSTFTEANIVTKIIKRALKLTDMNNSYKGGLSSYTIFLLVISYMKHINKNNNNNKSKSNSYGHIFHGIIKYFSKFDFDLNIVDIENKNGDIYNKRKDEYFSQEYEKIPIILDPVTGLNAGKSSFRINNVKNVFIDLNEEMEQLRNIYNKNDNNYQKEQENKENKGNNLIITLLKNVEKKYLNK